MEIQEKVCIEMLYADHKEITALQTTVSYEEAKRLQDKEYWQVLGRTKIGDEERFYLAKYEYSPETIFDQPAQYYPVVDRRVVNSAEEATSLIKEGWLLEDISISPDAENPGIFLDEFTLFKDGNTSLDEIVGNMIIETEKKISESQSQLLDLQEQFQSGISQEIEGFRNSLPSSDAMRAQFQTELNKAIRELKRDFEKETRKREIFAISQMVGIRLSEQKIHKVSNWQDYSIVGVELFCKISKYSQQLYEYARERVDVRGKGSLIRHYAIKVAKGDMTLEKAQKELVYEKLINESGEKEKDEDMSQEILDSLPNHDEHNGKVERIQETPQEEKPSKTTEESGEEKALKVCDDLANGNRVLEIPAEADLEQMTKAKLKELCDSLGISCKEKINKSDLIQTIENFRSANMK